ncbi:MAG TPA: ectonucleotide pyrophosphatase/phosphodiesterase [Chitinophagaceae bacterium]|nr:ectonucleotide pyrophosphatase/phosphodiesterase [Chitinophagaceae bacterium]
MPKFISYLILFIFCLNLSAQDTVQHIVQGRTNAVAQNTKPYVILISADGFRYDYTDKYKARNLQKLRRKGVKAKSMIPSFPSVTFPNHYSIATGLYPSHHGLVYNQFYDRNKKKSYTISNRKAVEDGSWYGGTPLWVLAEQQGMLSASYHFVGTEAPIQETLPTYWYKFNDNTDINYRINKVVDWLKLPEAIRPHLITFYISNVDHEGHTHGPETRQTEEAVQFVDKAIGAMVKKVNALGLPVNFIFLSDHGMAAVDTSTRINIASMIDTSRFIIKGGNTSLHLYAKNKADIPTTYDALKIQEAGFTVYLPDETPANWHYKRSDDRFDRIGDIFIVPDYPKVLSSWNGRISPGAHGFDPMMKEMHASFYAWGPQIKKGKTIASFENVHVYPFVCHLLGLTYSGKIDGNPEVLKGLLR